MQMGASLATAVGETNQALRQLYHIMKSNIMVSGGIVTSYGMGRSDKGCNDRMIKWEMMWSVLHYSPYKTYCSATGFELVVRRSIVTDLLLLQSRD